MPASLPIFCPNMHKYRRNHFTFTQTKRTTCGWPKFVRSKPKSNAPKRSVQPNRTQFEPGTDDDEDEDYSHWRCEQPEGTTQTEVLFSGECSRMGSEEGIPCTQTRRAELDIKNPYKRINDGPRIETGGKQHRMNGCKPRAAIRMNMYGYMLSLNMQRWQPGEAGFWGCIFDWGMFVTYVTFLSWV